MRRIDVLNSVETLAQCAEAVLADGPLVLTRCGKPLAAVIPIPGKVDLESQSLSGNPAFLDILEKSRRSYREHGGMPIEQVRRRIEELDRDEVNDTELPPKR